MIRYFYILLILPNLLLASEDISNKLFIDAKTKTLNSGCNIQSIALKVTNSVISSEQSQLLDSITTVISCLKNYEMEILPIYEEILTKYPYSQASYDLLNGFFIDRNTYNQFESLLINSIDTNMPISSLEDYEEYFKKVEQFMIDGSPIIIDKGMDNMSIDEIIDGNISNDESFDNYYDD